MILLPNKGDYNMNDDLNEIYDLNEALAKPKKGRRKKQTRKEILSLYQLEINSLNERINQIKELQYQAERFATALILKFGKLISKKCYKEDEQDFEPPKYVLFTKQEFEQYTEGLHEPNIFALNTDEGINVCFADDLHIITISGCGDSKVTNWYNHSDSIKNYGEDPCGIKKELMEKAGKLITTDE